MYDCLNLDGRLWKVRSTQHGLPFFVYLICLWYKQKKDWWVCSPGTAKPQPIVLRLAPSNRQTVRGELGHSLG